MCRVLKLPYHISGIPVAGTHRKIEIAADKQSRARNNLRNTPPTAEEAEVVDWEG